MKTLYHLGVSGGKDSTALLLWAIHESGLPREDLRVTFCDTGNEDPMTYAHITFLDQIAREAGIPGGVETLMPALTFFALALKKKRFPSRKAQFCTIELKIAPTKRWLAVRWAEGHEVVIINGKRRGESHQRRKSMANKPDRAFSDYWGCEEWAPLSDWTLAQVLAIHERHGVPLNPLYALGAKRVGCWPCINCGKLEIRLVAKHRPEKIDEIERWEGKVREGKTSPFFPPNMTTRAYRTVTVQTNDGRQVPVAPIRQVVEWSKTERGGKQLRLDYDEPKACFLGHLACE
jgi:3'-phosphoadenosine 5'-phosphosulfate sulfotransferase (PAPS reductase)/FAD synthetase